MHAIPTGDVHGHWSAFHGQVPTPEAGFDADTAYDLFMTGTPARPRYFGLHRIANMRPPNRLRAYMRLYIHLECNRYPAGMHSCILPTQQLMYVNIM